MKTIDIHWVGCAALACVLVWAVPTQVAAQTPATEQAAATSATPHAGRAGFDKPVTAARLAGYRGGTDIVSSDMRLSGTTAGNTAVNVATGTNAISAGSFSNMSGLPIVIQNTGANVLIQNAVILNLQMN
jgi:hypothetical protein